MLKRVCTTSVVINAIVFRDRESPHKEMAVMPSDIRGDNDTIFPSRSFAVLIRVNEGYHAGDASISSTKKLDYCCAYSSVTCWWSGTMLQHPRWPEKT